jgi:hypothetical protein
MGKKNSHPVANQFSDDEMDQIKRYGQALSGGVTPFGEEVEKHLVSVPSAEYGWLPEKGSVPPTANMSATKPDCTKGFFRFPRV